MRECYTSDRNGTRRNYRTIKEMCGDTIPRVIADGYSIPAYDAVSDECIGYVRVNPRGIYLTRARIESKDKSKLSARFIRYN